MVKNQPQKKVFTFFAYYWCEHYRERENVKKFHLCIGQSDEEDEKKECKRVYDKIVKPNGDPHRDHYYQKLYDDLEADLKNITNDFLRFANEFNQIPTACFELEPSSASH